LSIIAVVTSLALVVGLFVSGDHPAEAFTSTITATGRFAYVRPDGSVVGIRNAFVEMCDDDGLLGCPRMGTGTTDANGFFTVTGTGADPDFPFVPPDPPDPRMRVVATGPSGRVQTTLLADYCFRSAPINNTLPGTYSFGTMTPSGSTSCDIVNSSTAGHDGAWELYNSVRQEWESMRSETLRTPGRDIPQVRVIWPDNIGNQTFYRPPLPGLDEGSISIKPGDEFKEPVVLHEYGHHVLYHFGESPLPDYNNGICDTVNFLNFGGHCLWRSEKGAVAWTEGWPDFLAEFMSTTLGKARTLSTFGCDPLVPTICGTVESPPQPPPDPDLAHVEGTVAAVMWDLLDANQDNHDFDNSTDRLSLSFSTLWDLYQTFDPDPFTSHNNILDLDELWNGFASQRPTELNRVSEIYDENGLSKPAADLAVTAASTSASSVLPGAPLTITDTTSNIGAVRTGTSSVTRSYLVPTVGFSLLNPLGARTVGDVLPSGSAPGSTTVTLPSTTTAGSYVIRVCADDNGTTFETNESNNCRDTPAFTVQTSVSVGDATVTEGNTGTRSMTFPVTLSSPSSNTVSVDYTTSNGSAKAPADYSAISGTLSFAPGQTTKNITVQVRGDLLDENNETLIVGLSNPVNTVVGDGAAIGRINDDDPLPSLRINNVQTAEGQSGVKNLTFTVTLSAVSGRQVRVHWATANGSAVAGSDYVAASGTLTIAAGASRGTIVVQVKGDRTVEPNQAFKVKLSSPVSATIAVATGTGTIVNDD
jgi:hypothetical protein